MSNYNTSLIRYYVSSYAASNQLVADIWSIGAELDRQVIDDTELESLTEPLKAFLTDESTINAAAKAWVGTSVPSRFSHATSKLMKASQSPDKAHLFENSTARGHETVQAKFKVSDTAGNYLRLPIKVAHLANGWRCYMEEDGPKMVSATLA